ncbi:Methyl farnesoate epoxidase [Blattella germanica]|nr:Methyl farnesoate epoxidase [Blattella germanica]
MFAISAINVLWGMTAGTRYARDDAEIKPVLLRLKKVFQTGSPSGGLVQAFPILRRIAPGLVGYAASMQNLQEMQSMFRVKEGLITLCVDLFVAGGESTASSIEFSLLYMVLYPEVQKAVQKELDTVVGQNRRPTLEDRPKYITSANKFLLIQHYN